MTERGEKKRRLAEVAKFENETKGREKKRQAEKRKKEGNLQRCREPAKIREKRKQRYRNSPDGWGKEKYSVRGKKELQMRFGGIRLVGGSIRGGGGSNSNSGGIS